MDILLAGNRESEREKIMDETKPKKIILPEEAVRLLSIYYISVWKIAKAVVEEKERLKK